MTGMNVKSMKQHQHCKWLFFFLVIMAVFALQPLITHSSDIVFATSDLTPTPTETTAPDLTTPTELTDPDVTEPTTEPTTLPSEPAVTEPTTLPTEPAVTEPTSEPTEPDVTEPTTEPTEPVVTEPTTEPTEPVVTELTTEPTEPVVTEPTEPVVTELTTEPEDPSVFRELSTITPDLLQNPPPSDGTDPEEPEGQPEDMMMAAFEAPAPIDGTADNVVLFVEGNQLFTNIDNDNAIQQAVDAALQYAFDHASTSLTITVNNGTYKGGLVIEPATTPSGLTLYIKAHDAGATYLTSAGGVGLAGDIFIDYDNIQLILAGLYLSLDAKIKASSAQSVTYYGTTGDDTASLNINGQTTTELYGGEGEDKLTITSSGDYYATGSDAGSSSAITLDGGGGVDRLTVHSNTAFANGNVTVTAMGGIGDDRLHLSGMLDDSYLAEDRMTGDASSFVLNAMAESVLFGEWQVDEYRNSLTIIPSGFESFTDDLEHKQTVELPATGDYGPTAGASFTDYKINPAGTTVNKRIDINNAVDLFLSKVWVKGDIIDVQKLDAPDMDVFLQGRLVTALAGSTISGRSVRIEAYDDDSHTISSPYENTLQDDSPLNNVEVSAFDIRSESKVTIGAGASVTSSHSIDITAQSIQTKPLLPTFEGVTGSNLLNFNFLALKNGKARILIDGLLQAAEAIRATALARILVSAASDNISLLMPLSIGVVSALAEIVTSGSAQLDAGTDVTLRASTDVDLTAAARTGVIPLAIAVSVAKGDAIVKVGGNTQISAGHDVTLSACGRMKVLTEASQPVATPASSNPSIVPGSGGFFAISVVKQNVLATLTENAKAMTNKALAGGNLSILADAHESVTNTAQSSPKQTDQNGDQDWSLSTIIGMVMNLKSLKTSESGDSAIGTDADALAAAPDGQGAGGGGVNDVVDKGTGGAKDTTAEGGGSNTSSFQIVGALGVLYASNVCQAILNTTQPITVTGNTRISALAETSVANIGDGSPVGSDPASSFGIGVGVAVSVVHHMAQAIVDSNLTTGGLQLEAITSNLASSAIAKAGASSGSIGLAGAIAVHILDALTEALVKSTAIVSLGNGSLEATAKILKSTLVTSAEGSAEASEGSVGIGAGIAVAVTGIKVNAAIADGAALLNQTDTRLAKGSITAQFTGTEDVKGKAGGSGGTIALMPALALTISKVKTTATIGSAPANAIPLDVVGDFDINANGSMTRTSAADGSCTGGSAAVGMALAINILNDSATSRVGRSIRARNIRVGASSVSRIKATVKSSAAGTEPSESSGGTEEGTGEGTEEPPADPPADPPPTPDEEIDDTFDGEIEQTVTEEPDGEADAQADNVATTGSGLASLLGNSEGNTTESKQETQDSVNNRKKASTSEGTVAVSASFILNLLKNKSLAIIDDGISITAVAVDGIGGAVAVTSENDTDGKAVADSSATKGSIGVGVSIAIQDIDYENIAKVGDARISAASLSVIAKTVGAELRESIEDLTQTLRESIDDDRRNDRARPSGQPARLASISTASPRKSRMLSSRNCATRHSTSTHPMT